MTNTDIAQPTPERIALSGGAFTTNEDGARQFADELLVRMYNKGQLYPDKQINESLYLAGEKYYADWYGAGMSTLQAVDYGKVSGGQGGSGSSMPAGMMQTKCRQEYRRAREALGVKYRPAVELVVLEGQTDLVAIGKRLTGTASPHSARTVAVERFTSGLYLLAKHYLLVK